MSERYIYIKETGQVAGPLTMNEPKWEEFDSHSEAFYPLDNKAYHYAINEWKNHLKSLPRIDIVGEHSFLDGQILEEGKDIRFDHCYPKGMKMGQEQYSNILQPTYGTVATPLKQVQKEKDLEPNVHPTNEDSLATLACTSGNNIEQGWISVKDRLPEISGFYIAYDPNYGHNEQNYIDIYRYAKYKESWYWGSDCFHPTHWMPLPEKPNSEQGVQECDANTLNQGTEPMANNNSFTEEDLLELIRYCAEMELYDFKGIIYAGDDDVCTPEEALSNFKICTPKEILTNFKKQQKGA